MIDFVCYLQMFKDPDQQYPLCRFKKEGPGRVNEDPFEPDCVAAQDLPSEIQRRTESLVGRTKDRVSAEPILLQVHYRHSANLTVYDTPGRSEEHTSELQSLMRISYAVFC